MDVCVFQLQVRGIALSSARSDLGSKGISRSLPMVHKFGSGRNDGQSSGKSLGWRTARCISSRIK